MCSVSYAKDSKGAVVINADSRKETRNFISTFRREGEILKSLKSLKSERKSEWVKKYLNSICLS